LDAGNQSCWVVQHAHALPMRAIVNGHNIQPRGDNLNALGYSDLTSQESEEVDRLYRQLVR
jgi:hypothetical protein